MTDLRNAFRQLRRAPAISVAAILTLALGIGATTALFTVVNSVLLRPLPYPEPDRLARVYSAWPERGNFRGPVSVPDVEDWAERSRTFEAMAVYSTTPSSLVLQTDGGAAELSTVHVTAGFFPTMGVAPILGRVFTREDERDDP